MPCSGTLAQKPSISLLSATNRGIPAEVILDSTFNADSLDGLVLPDSVELHRLLKPSLEELLPGTGSDTRERIFSLIIRSLHPVRMRFL